MADKIVFVNIDDIIYCEAHGSYTNVCFHDGRKIVTSKSLCDFELQLTDHKFFRIHHSSLINLNRVKEFQRHNGGYVIMENGSNWKFHKENVLIFWKRFMILSFENIHI